ncbi:MAG: B12-binding domain-containing radical SAM protein [bacterium]|nr:MAG: B12-binding domain-containing radical SAM protein [bacterium]
MKVLLISPQGSNIYAKMKVGLPPLGVAYLAAVIREKGYEVKIIDKSIEQRKLTPVDFAGFDLIGISADTPRYPEAVEIARMAKKTGKIVVMGGYHVTFLDKEALETGVVDIIVRGEAEEIMVNLLDTLENNGDLHKVKGISYIKNGELIRTPPAPPPNNLDTMPFPARDLLPMDKYNSLMAGLPVTNLITSRGCPFNCYFCSSSKFGGLKWRYRSAKSIVDEIEILYHNYGYRAFAFMDDNFTLSKRRVLNFADELEKRHMDDIIWWCFSRVDILIRNEDMVKRMAEAGAFQIFLGLESYNENTLDDYGKNVGNKEQDQAIKLLHKYGINIHGSFIVGDINETKEMAEQTAKWAQKVNPRVTQFSILTPYPGTALYHDVEREGRSLHKNWELYDALHATVKTDGMNPDEVQKMLIKDYRMAFLNKYRLFHPRKFSPAVTHRLNKLNSRQGRLKNLIKPIRIFGTFWMEMQRTKPQKYMGRMTR